MRDGKLKERFAIGDIPSADPSRGGPVAKIRFAKSGPKTRRVTIGTDLEDRGVDMAQFAPIWELTKTD